MALSGVELGKLIKEARKASRLTQAQLAERLDLSTYQHISKWERGGVRPTLPNLRKLSRVLGVDFLVLEEGDGKDSAQGTSALRLPVGIDTIRSPIVREVLEAATRPGAFRSFGREAHPNDMWRWIYDKCFDLGARVQDLKELDPIRDLCLEPTE
ncbi:MAG: helix-turn-helix protein [Gemmatimonadetes bacterium]|nr:helix-turn-helix protein [Gemmatimonadota bacterium]